MQSVLWRAVPVGSSKALRHCGRCGRRSEFYSSGMFRVNAQQKKLDVWLIYRCTVCGSVWNMTVVSRKSPDAIGSELEGFFNNDPGLAKYYGRSATLLWQNGAELCKPQFYVEGESPDRQSETRIMLYSDTPELRVSDAVRQKLGLHRSAYENLCGQGILLCASGQDLKKGKIGPGADLLLLPE